MGPCSLVKAALNLSLYENSESSLVLSIGNGMVVACMLVNSSIETLLGERSVIIWELLVSVGLWHIWETPCMKDFQHKVIFSVEVIWEFRFISFIY